MSLLSTVKDLFNQEIFITPGDQTIPYLALDVLNLCIMNLKILKINPLPKSLIEGMAAKLKELKPNAADISDSIKMQRLYAEDMLQSFDADISYFEKTLKYFGPAAKIGFGAGLVGGGVGLIGATQGASASTGIKLIIDGGTLSITGAWELCKVLPGSSSNWYPKTLAVYLLLSAINEMNANQEQNYKQLFETILEGDNVKECGIGLFGIIYRLTQLYPQVTQPVKANIIQTLSTIGNKEEYSCKPAIRKNAVMALRYLHEFHDSSKAEKEYQKCLSTVSDEEKLERAIEQQYLFFRTLNIFIENIPREFTNAESKLLIDVLEEDKIRAHQLQEAEQSQSFDKSASTHKIQRNLDVKGKVGTAEMRVASATGIPERQTKAVLAQQLAIANLGVKSDITVHPGAVVDTLNGGMFNMDFAPSSKDKKKSKKEKKAKPAAATFFADSNRISASTSATTATSPSAAADPRPK